MCAVTCKTKPNEGMLFSFAREVVDIKIADIYFFEVLNRVITVHYMRNGRERTFDFYNTLKSLEHLLHGQGFIRVHKSYLVAERHITAASKQSVLLSNGAELPLGRACFYHLQKAGYVKAGRDHNRKRGG